MYAAGEAVSQALQISGFPKFNRFELEDRELIQTYIDTFRPASCEYNFSNLYAWQDVYKMSWTLYRERLLIYDGLSQYAFMPLGRDFRPEELAILSVHLKKTGLTPNFCLATPGYLERFPGIEKYYTIRKELDSAEYIYDAASLYELTGVKLHKKRNLISQFKRSYPHFEVHPLKGAYKTRSLEFAQNLLNRRGNSSKTLYQEFCAMEMSFNYFEQLGLEGLVITLENKLIAFSVFSALNPSTYDIQFEKSDTDYKGAAQVINNETAKYLTDKCRYLNREQDLGIKGLRQAKMSYDPVELITPYSLTFTPPN